MQTKPLEVAVHTSRVTIALFTQSEYYKLIKALYQCMQQNSKLDFIG